MIPKIIHYCWFGNGKYPPIVKKCIASWKKFCPDYEIKLWKETNYDVTKNDYMYEAYKAKKWAFVSDYARLDIIYQHGGIYLDTDVELIKPLDDLLKLNCFVAKDEWGVCTGLGFGAIAQQSTIKEMLNLYANKHFMTVNGPDLTPCTYFNTKPFLDAGYNVASNEIIKLKDVYIFPPEYFCPIQGKYSELKITNNTYCIHWNSRLWETGLTSLKAKVRLFLGIQIVNKLKKFFK